MGMAGKVKPKCLQLINGIACPLFIVGLEIVKLVENSVDILSASVGNVGEAFEFAFFVDVEELARLASIGSEIFLISIATETRAFKQISLKPNTKNECLT